MVITAEATPLNAKVGSRTHVSATTKIERRKDQPILSYFEYKKEAKKAAPKKADKKSAKKSAKKGNK